MSAEVRFITAAVTHVGCVRTVNQDAHLTRDEIGLWAVADGMGGLQAGEVAAAAIVDVLAGVSLGGGFASHMHQLKMILSAVNGEIFAAAEAAGARMGSTAAILHIDAMRCGCIWVGDSRIYRLRDGYLTRLTRDHTPVQEMHDSGLLTAREMPLHPMAHVLTRAVGVEPVLEVEMRTDALKAGDVLLLCSDGLTGPVSDDEIAALLGEDSRAACGALLDLALERGAPDNVTVVTVGCEAPGG
ncbi:MAG: PP2C family protein-serine/threonine phosphatase [Caulobacterales bacterium]